MNTGIPEYDNKKFDLLELIIKDKKCKEKIVLLSAINEKNKEKVSLICAISTGRLGNYEFEPIAEIVQEKCHYRVCYDL